jgi:predicted DCC family thiol-disulfide oxidoreductase YuxK
MRAGQRLLRARGRSWDRATAIGLLLVALLGMGWRLLVLLPRSAQALRLNGSEVCAHLRVGL